MVAKVSNDPRIVGNAVELASAPVPALLPDHLADLRRSGLSDEQIRTCGFYSETDPMAIASLLGWKSKASALGSCLVIPFTAPDGSQLDYRRVRPSTPRKDSKKARTIKYESPLGKANRAYFPPGTLPVLADASVTLIVTEGEKKSAKADQEGFPCIGLVGVSGWQMKRSKNAAGKSEGPRRLIPDLDAVAWRGRSVLVVYDSDAATNVNVVWAEFHLATALAERGAEVRIVRIPPGADSAKVGLDDLLVAEGPDAFRKLMATAVPATRPMAASDNRTLVLVGPDEYRVNDEVTAVLADDHSIHQRSGELVRISVDPVTSPRIDVIPPASLRDKISRSVAFYTVKETPDGDAMEYVHPPMWCINGVATRGTWPKVRPLAGIVSFPVIRPDGSIFDEPGYDEATNLYLHWTKKPLPIPNRPSVDDARAMAAKLFDAVGDFPFQQRMHRSAWLAGLLTPLARSAIRGPSPLFMVDGNVRGCGKGMLLEVIARIVTGLPFPVISYPTRQDEEELRKKITMLLMYGERIALFDNLTGAFGDGCLDRALTASEWQDRVLGGNRQFRGPQTLTLYATGNNVAILADTARRICHIRLESPEERPENRSGFKRPNLLDWVYEQRDELLAAALGFLRAYHCAGRPDMQLKPWGSYEAWSAFVRNACVWAGFPDPGETREQLQANADETARGLKQMIDVLLIIDPDRLGYTAGELVDRAGNIHSAESSEVREMLAEAIFAIAGKLDARKLGTRLGRLKRRIVGRHYLDVDLARANRWVVRDRESLREAADDVVLSSRPADVAYVADDFGSDPKSADGEVWCPTLTNQDDELSF